MKRFLLIFLIIGNQGFSQVNQSLDELITLRAELINEIGILEDSLFRVNKQIKMIVSLEECKPFEEKPREVDRRQLFPGQESTTVAGGDGISFSLGGRSALKLPTPQYPSQKSGIVVVEVTVDRNGNVTNARGGVRGSTTNDAELVNAAEKAARRARFDVNQNAAAYQTGTITYVFKLQN